MTVTTLSQALHDRWVPKMPGGAPDAATLRSGLASDLLVEDWLIGMRAKVTATGATVGGNRTITIQRPRETAFDVVLPAASTLWFTRV